MQEVQAVAGVGLLGDRYAFGTGSWNKTTGVGKRQVTLMNDKFIQGSTFGPQHTRRNIITRDIELMWLIGREFTIGAARFRGVKYCDPCQRPSKLSAIEDFTGTFQDSGGLIAEVLDGGLIKVGDAIIPPPRGY